MPPAPSRSAQPAARRDCGPLAISRLDDLAATKLAREHDGRVRMTAYLIKRLFSVIVLAFAISVAVFLIIRLIPGDPVLAMLGTSAADPGIVARLHRQLGLNLPITTQYFHWIGGGLHGNLGYSYGQQEPVASLIAANFMPTLELTAVGLFLTIFFGLIIGVAAAIRRNSVFDTTTMAISMAFLSLPSFWLRLVLLVVFSVNLHWFAVVGGGGFQGQ